MRAHRSLAVIVIVAAMLLPEQRGTAQVDEALAAPADEARIMMRWWWFGPSMTREQADREMQRMKEGGIGGFEIATVYPMAVDDSASGFRNYPYLSSEYLDLIGFTARRAKELGLRMDVTLGSGWSFGGPHITPELAAARLRVDRRELAQDVRRIARPVPWEHESLIAAFVGNGSTREVDPATFRPLDLSGSGPIEIPAGSGPRAVLFYFSSRTGQVVKRAAIGAEGYVLDHYSRAAIETHLRQVGDKLVAAAGPGGIHAIFCDSLEVYEADWTADMLQEFQRRRGYDLRPLLHMLDYDAGERSREVRQDFGVTLTELYEERFLAPIREWADRHKVRFRIQGYGAPPAALASFRYADLFEGEGFEWRMASRARWAASAAHLFGRRVASSETWTWIHSPAFRATPIDVKGEADQHFLSGINQLIGHGWPATPASVPSPGWPFYAAGAFTDKNPWWPVMPDLAKYLQRVSHLLRQGEPVADVALYAPQADARAAMRPGTGAYLNLWQGVNSQIPAGTIPAILDGGYSFDLFDDGTLVEVARRPYKAVVLAGARSIPAATRQWLEVFTQKGGAVIAGGDLEAALRKTVAPDVELMPRTSDIGFVHRKLQDGDIYFLANTANRAQRVAARFRDAGGRAELWDPVTGRSRPLAHANGGFALQFEPYQSLVIRFRSGAAAADDAQRHVVSREELSTGWRFGAGGAPAEDVGLPHSWTDRAATRHFSGTGTYTRTWTPPAATLAAGVRVYLDFGEARGVDREALADGTMRGNSFAALVSAPVRDAATVYVNGRRAGSVWTTPYKVDVTPFLRPGVNDIRVDVYNTAINQLAEGGRLPDVAAVGKVYGQRFRLQDMDNLRPLPSGLQSVPAMVAER